jgi:hypothetical protein
MRLKLRVHTTKATVGNARSVVLFHDALQRQICKNRDRISFVEFNCSSAGGGRRRRRSSSRRRARFSCVVVAVVGAVIKTFSAHRLPTKENKTINEASVMLIVVISLAVLRSTRTRPRQTSCQSASHAPRQSPFEWRRAIECAAHPPTDWRRKSACARASVSHVRHPPTVPNTKTLTCQVSSLSSFS